MKKLAIIIVLGCWFATLWYGKAGFGQEDVCNRARAAYAAGRAAEAGPLLDSCRKAVGGDPAILLLEAKSFYRSGQFRETQRLALQVLTQLPASSDAMYLLGHAYERDKRPTESLAWFTKAAAISKPTTEDLRTVALDYVLLDDYPDAIHWLERAVAFDQRNAEAWYDLGRARMMQGDSAAAEKALKTSLQLQPQSAKAENNLGVTFEAENRLSDALQAYRLAIEWQSTSAQPSEQPFLNLGALLITQERSREAVPLLEKAVNLAQDNVKAHEQLARALAQAGELAKALPQMQLAVKLEGGNARLHYELGQMYRRAGRTEEARDELRLSGQLYQSHSTSIDH